jgi:hypothetical protein
VYSHFHDILNTTSRWRSVASQSKMLPGQSKHEIYNVINICEAEKKMWFNTSFKRCILNVKRNGQIRNNAVLWISCQTIWTVPVFFVARWRTSDPTAIIPGRLTALLGRNIHVLTRRGCRDVCTSRTITRYCNETDWADSTRKVTLTLRNVLIHFNSRERKKFGMEGKKLQRRMGRMDDRKIGIEK